MPVEIASTSSIALQKLRCYNWIMNTSMIQTISDERLIQQLKEAVTRERHATAQLIALLAELDTRRLYLAEGYSSLFVYCTQCLHLSEHAAYARIEAARTARKFPVVLNLLTDGSITLTTVGLLTTHLTSNNHDELLEAARHKSKREVEQQVAALRPLPPVPSVLRKLPGPKPTFDAPLAGSVQSTTWYRATCAGKIQNRVHRPNSSR
jgi:hypothetical protein